MDSLRKELQILHHGSLKDTKDCKDQTITELLGLEKTCRDQLVQPSYQDRLA